jgi:hypothetical protein
MQKFNKAVKVEIFNSFKDANTAEHKRCAYMSPKQRWDELAILQKRVWGSRWSRGKIKRIASYEKLRWLK